MRKARAGRAGRGGGGLPAWARTDGPTREATDDGEVEVQRLQPYQATKAYACPGCHATIPPGRGHLVVVPLGAPDDRRHWHRSCWERRDRRGAR